MHLDAPPALSGSRKRSIQELHVDDDEDELVASHKNYTDAAPKRLRNRRGNAVHRKIIKYDVQALLNHLAFTRFYVTANFQNYNQTSSPVIICIVSNHLQLYNALW